MIAQIIKLLVKKVEQVLYLRVKMLHIKQHLIIRKQCLIKD